MRNRALLEWYDRAGRDLPWRRTKDPWAILVSEVMLQQTQVTRVEPAYRDFMERYPHPSDLAAARPADVVNAWGELGYLRRARSLQAAARRIAEEGWPEDLTVLPGVGPYTATAIRVFADDARLAAIDINLRRVLSRWVGTELTVRAATALGNEIVDFARPRDWNQAMMDLGAGLCRPTSPRCTECPVAALCLDPTVEVSVRRQSPFEGSRRQARAAILKQLARGTADLDELVERTGLEASTVSHALEALIEERAVIVSGGRLDLG